MNELKQTGVSEKKDGFKKRVSRFFRNIVIIAVLISAFAIYWFFFNKYSDGERKGTLIKITHKGNIFKTDEGEMWLSCRQTMNPEKFYFSVTNDSLANVMKNLQDECVQVTYVQYRATLPWRGDSKYIVTGVIPIRQQDQ
ncbi:MAG: hypothetical protein JNN00_11715 [Chitinophagaceae bacterium]|nr:hypothetical protein [Chitinophagaceae bacterium]